MTMNQEYKLGCYVGQLNDRDYSNVVAALLCTGIDNKDIESLVCKRVSDLDCIIDVMSVLS